MSQEKNLATFAPLDLFCGEENLLSAQAQRRWLLALVIVGLVLRLTHYLLRFPLWADEAGLSANFLDRGYGGLLQPLHYCQVAPTLFLWGQLTLVKLLGFHEYTLRLMPFLCAVGSLLLFRHVAGRLLQGTALVLAVGLFAVSSRIIWYAAEAKPYGCDLLGAGPADADDRVAAATGPDTVALVSGRSGWPGRGLLVSRDLRGWRSQPGGGVGAGAGAATVAAAGGTAPTASGLVSVDRL